MVAVGGLVEGLLGEVVPVAGVRGRSRRRRRRRHDSGLQAVASAALPTPGFHGDSSRPAAAPSYATGKRRDAEHPEIEARARLNTAPPRSDVMARPRQPSPHVPPPNHRLELLAEWRSPSAHVRVRRYVASRASPLEPLRRAAGARVTRARSPRAQPDPSRVVARPPAPPTPGDKPNAENSAKATSTAVRKEIKC